MFSLASASVPSTPCPLVVRGYRFQDFRSSEAREHRKAERLALDESKPLIKRDGGVVREHVQEGRSALVAKLAHEPGDEKGGVAFAAVFGADTDRANFDRSIEPDALAGHGRERAVDPDADVLAELVRARAERAGVGLFHETQHLRDVASTEHDGRETFRRRRRLSVSDHLEDRG